KFTHGSTPRMRVAPGGVAERLGGRNGHGVHGPVTIGADDRLSVFLHFLLGWPLMPGEGLRCHPGEEEARARKPDEASPVNGHLRFICSNDARDIISPGRARVSLLFC